MRRRCRAGEIVNAIDLELEMVDDIMTYQFEARIPDQMLDVDLSSGEKIIQADDFVALLNQTVAEMGTEESGTAGNQDTHRKASLAENLLKGKAAKIGGSGSV